MKASDLGDLVERLTRALVVTPGRRDGDPETRVRLDHLIPPVGGQNPVARWRLMTTNTHLYQPLLDRAALRAWHSADGAKGRRLMAVDLANDDRVAAILSWHFEPGSAGSRPHLVTAAAVREQADLRAESFIALELLFAVVLAIDARTVLRRMIGLVNDNAIAVSESELQLAGFVRGTRRTGYGGDYWSLR